MRTPSLKAIKTFQIAARHSSFAVAADELCITPSAVSHQIKTLETQLGLPLFSRSARAHALTDAGARYLEQIDDLFTRLESVTAQLRERYGRNSVRLHVPAYFASEMLLPRLSEFSKLHDGIDTRLRSFIEAQHLFFVATAPLGTDGHVNVSPKGLDGTFAVLDERTVAYLDLTGSGSETAAHLRENGRITVMFCAFEGAPNIVRLHGTGRYVTLADAEFASYRELFAEHPGARGIVVIDVHRVSDSCGYAVPLMMHDGDRDLLTRWADNRGDDGLATYRAVKNATSIDGLPALDVAAQTSADPR